MKIIKINEKPELIPQAAKWFHQRWNIPEEAYSQSMQTSLHQLIPSWYLIMHEQTIIGGGGVIENDFHERIDLTPNLCALYIEEAYRSNGLAKQLLNYICNDFMNHHISTLYLITDHTSFYEQCGWQYLCSCNQGRIYQHILIPA